jgi:hypothetical protein
MDRTVERLSPSQPIKRPRHCFNPLRETGRLDGKKLTGDEFTRCDRGSKN